MDSVLTKMIRRLLDNKMIRAMNTFFSLIRIRNCFIVFFGVLIGAMLITDGGEIIPPSKLVYIAGFSAAFIMMGGNTLNDYFDIDIDKVNKPNKPLPSGKISRSDTLMLSIGLFLIGAGLAKSINIYCLSLAVVNIVMLILYAIYSKRLILISNFTIAYLVASVFLFGALSAGNVDLLTKSRFVVVLSVCAFFMTFSREIVKDIEDIEGDKKMYSQTLPIVYGAKKAKRLAMMFGLFAILLSVVPYLMKYPGINHNAYAIVIGFADLVFLSALTMFAPLGQRIMVFGMILSLSAFFFGRILN